MTREEAIEVFKTEHPYNPKRKDNDLHTLAKAFDLAISALSENKGKWIDNGNGSYTCSNCKTEWTTSQIEKMCFCPTCGADMREPKGEKGTE